MIYLKALGTHSRQGKFGWLNSMVRSLCVIFRHRKNKKEGHVDQKGANHDGKGVKSMDPLGVVVMPDAEISFDGDANDCPTGSSHGYFAQVPHMAEQPWPRTA